MDELSPRGAPRAAGVDAVLGRPRAAARAVRPRLRPLRARGADTGARQPHPRPARRAPDRGGGAAAVPAGRVRPDAPPALVGGAAAARRSRARSCPRSTRSVDLNNCLSVELVVPACVMRAEPARRRSSLRAGRDGERCASLRGPFDARRQAAARRRRGTVRHADHRTASASRCCPGPRRAWLVAYLPAGVVAAVVREEALAVAPGRGAGRRCLDAGVGIRPE